MKMSFSLSDDVAGVLKSRAREVAGGNVSLLTDVALKLLLEMPSADVSKLVNRRRMDRMAATRDGWYRAFWSVLGEEMGRSDTIDNPCVPRNYGDFYIVLLLNHHDRYDDENDPFCPYVGPRTVQADSPQPHQWTFNRSESPVLAAEIVASKLRDLGATATA